jgi:SAM-dependent methyltransferase
MVHAGRLHMNAELSELQAAIDGLISVKESLDVLDAGCGAKLNVRFPKNAYITGIDISQLQLSRNHCLHRKILGDIQCYRYPPSCFDVIVCWDVLEHVKKPTDALERLAAALRENGIIVLSAPNLFSLKGIITRITPYAFHLWFYRTIRGWKEAGVGGNPPFPTYLRYAMSPRAIRRFACAHRMKIVYERYSGRGDSRDIIGRDNRWLTAIAKVLNIFTLALSFGTFDPKFAQYYFLLRKLPQAQFMN